MKTKQITERLKAGDVLVLRESYGYDALKKNHQYTIRGINGRFVEFDYIDPYDGCYVEVHIYHIVTDFEIVINE